jgi:hypothetical protein
MICSILPHLSSIALSEDTLRQALIERLLSVDAQAEDLPAPLLHSRGSIVGGHASLGAD